MRARFTVSDIATAALEIVDRDGLSGLSMRSLAGSLGTGPMTLYNYVRDRGELEELVAEAVITEVKVPVKSDNWCSDVRAIALAMWETLRRHPNAIPLVLTRRTVSASSYLAADRLIAALTRAGLDAEDLLASFRAVLGLVMGSAQAELAGPLAGPGRDREQVAVAARIGRLAGEEHPHIAALSQVSQQSTAAADFERGLNILLVGIESLGSGQRPALD
ncbi:TetR/AcrR family transcriptional regulator C-terminal domain-containing protein [Mycobacterium vicinigordonae]|uniref:TetR/AcrR family transcriptional regulator C-terminal domain-containing protein n=1 Tax=Mycobacterium vicinigordonae TaxID=1719132 RepID=A0A7D6HUJ6_9MYCO|nr:TetR/AcrR family transcriptional regulator C-terminal domain-containing protein [Mycobacterium vicinigordonae]QLL10331.1 TetR/AcrR family transcriptional regulator C-terminal domain-containing protein [Mycobacterium vicinigordonae]